MDLKSDYKKDKEHAVFKDAIRKSIASKQPAVVIQSRSGYRATLRSFWKSESKYEIMVVGDRVNVKDSKLKMIDNYKLKTNDKAKAKKTTTEVPANKEEVKSTEDKAE